MCNMSVRYAAQSDIFSSRAHFTIHILSNEDEQKKVHTSNCIKYIYSSLQSVYTVYVRMAYAKWNMDYIWEKEIE